uniref:Protein-lysine N-methyltransferase n=1 Tax=Rhizophora mucronata TaxID=61149 RepID=A0A2P2J845_RHIMU
MEEKMERPNHDGVFVDEDDPPMLSSHALAALKEFLEEKQQSVGDQTTENAERGAGEKVDLVDEDWRLSQFWYDPLTAETIAEEVVLALCKNTAAGGGKPNSIPNTSVACVACPTLYAYIKKIDPDARAQLLEYDKRFEQYGSDFTFYDYNQPEDLPTEFKHSFQVVVADPPYLSKECLEKIAQTISFLAAPGKSYLLLLTGEVQKDTAAELLGLHPCGFRPQHSSKLGNEFRLFTNYDPGMRLGGWEL